MYNVLTDAPIGAYFELPMKPTTKKPTESWYSNVPTFMGPEFSYCDQDCRPHWKAYGTGISRFQVRAERDGTFHMETYEAAEGKKSGKETWVTLPKAAVVDLIEFLQAHVGEEKNA